MIRSLLAACFSLVVIPAEAADREFFTHPFLVLTAEEDLTASVAAGDFNGDGAVDILETNGRHWPQANRIRFNNGEGRLGRSMLIGDHEAPSYQLVPGDFDGDGDLDAIEATDRAGTWLYRNRGDGTFEIKNVGADPTSSRSAVAFDADGDGDLDAFLSNRGGPGVLLRNRGDGKFGAETVETSESGSVGSAAADFNGDNAPDLLLAVRDGDSALVLLNDGVGGFSEKKAFGLSGIDIRAVTAGDMDGDGRTDILYGVVGGESLILFGDGDGGVKRRAFFGPPDSEAYALAVSDFDHDGDLDIAMARSEQTNLVFFNAGAGEDFETVELEEGLWTAPEDGEEPPDTYNLVVVDINGDDYDDIVFANSFAANPIYLNRPASRD